jgi:alpha-glucosidase
MSTRCPPVSFASARATSVAAAAILATLCARSVGAQDALTVRSPDGRTEVSVAVTDGALTYSVTRNGRGVLTPSRLGFEFRGAPRLRDSVRVTGSARGSADRTWTQPWGEVRRVRDRHNELRVDAAEMGVTGRRFSVVFRVFDDGVGFRYELPAQPGAQEYEITDELTEFALADHARAWWIASNRPRLDRSEQLYSSGPVSTLDSV